MYFPLEILQKFSLEYIFTEISVSLWKSTLLDRILEKEVHFRPDCQSLNRRRRNIEKRNISLAILRSVGRYSWIMWCRKNALFSTSSRAQEDLWLREELDRVYSRAFEMTVGVCHGVISSCENYRKKCVAPNKRLKKRANMFYFLLFYIDFKFIILFLLHIHITWWLNKHIKKFLSNEN